MEILRKNKCKIILFDNIESNYIMYKNGNTIYFFDENSFCTNINGFGCGYMYGFPDGNGKGNGDTLSIENQYRNKEENKINLSLSFTFYF
jgi:hypothetical protein